MDSYFSKTRDCPKPQEDAHKRAQELQHNFFICWEKEYKPNKFTNTYYSYPTIEDFLQIYQTTNENNRRFYEQLTKQFVEIYDIDGRYSDPAFKDKSDDRIIRDFINSRKDWGDQNEWNNGEILSNEIYIKNASRKADDKVSFHIIIRNGFFFDNVKVAKIYMREFYTWLIENEYPILFDNAIYTKNRNIRILGSHKGKNPNRPLKRSYFNHQSLNGDIRLFFASYLSDKDSSPIVKGNENKSEEHENPQQMTSEERSSDPEIFVKIKSYIDENAPDCFEVSSERDSSGFFHLKRTDSCYCLVAPEEKDRPHDNLDSFAFTRDDKIFIGCFCNPVSRRAICINPSDSSQSEGSEERSSECKRCGKSGIENWKTLCTGCWYSNYKKSVVDEITRLPTKNRVDIPVEEKWVLPIKMDKKCVVIRANLGSGKSCRITEYIDSLDTKTSSILVITPRRSYANTTTERLVTENKSCKVFECYLDKPNISNVQYLVCQVESLWKIQSDYDLIIIDECESNLVQLTSINTHKENLIYNIEKFTQLLAKANNIICADAFISKRTTNILENLNIHYTFYNYLHLPEERKYQRYHLLPQFKTKLVNDLSEGKKILFFCSSITKLREQFIPAIKDKIPDIRIGEYNSRNLTTPLKNVNEEWSQFDIVAMTATVTVGCNFDIKDYFDKVYIYDSASSRNRTRDIIQAHYRVRHIKDKELHLFLDTRTYFMRNEDLTMDRTTIAESLETKKIIINRLIEQECGYKVIDETPNFMRELFISNILEYNTSLVAKEEMWDLYLKLCNYKEMKADMIKIDFNIKATKKKRPAWKDIPDIYFDEYKDLWNKKQKEPLTEEEDNKLEKFMFNMYFSNPTINQTVVQKYWIIWSEFCSTKIKFMSWEKGVIEETYSLRDAIEKENQNKLGFAEFSSGNELKLFFSRQLANLLGIKNFSDFRSHLTIQKINDIIEDIEERKEELEVVFNLRKSQSKKDEFTKKNFIELLNRIFDQCSFSKFVKSKKIVRKRVDGKRVDFTPYELQHNFKIINPLLGDEDIWSHIDAWGSRNVHHKHLLI